MRSLRSTILILFCCTGCLEPYTPPLNPEALNALVVDGFIDSHGFASVILSRTISVGNNGNTPNVSGAIVSIESSVGEKFHLSEKDSSTYTASDLHVDLNSTYTLYIKTPDGREYRSGNVSIRPTPPIDSIFFVPSAARDAIEIRVNSTDSDLRSTGYFLWDAIETYEYHAPTYSGYKFVNKDAVERTPDEQIYSCWRTVLTNAVMASTQSLSSNTINSQRVATIGKGTEKLSVRYSILVKQRVISEEEYEFRIQLQKSTEQQGSIFATIPGAVVSNVHSINSNDEYVLGYFSGQDVKERRFFIDHGDLPTDFLDFAAAEGCHAEATCRIDEPILGPTDCVLPSALGDETIITNVLKDVVGNIVALFYVPLNCGDCRVKGGETTPPDFW
jgi:hypothetical protein